MKNYHQVATYEGDPQNQQARRVESHKHTVHSSNAQAANRPLYLQDAQANFTSVSREPAPSFLTQMPLGTPHHETVGATHDVGLAQNWPHHPRPNHVPRHVEVAEFSASKGEDYYNGVDRAKRPAGGHKRVRNNGFKHRWVYEEVGLSMSKMSIMSLVLGLLFLGALFFVIGFLAAVATLKTEQAAHNSQSAWQASNASAQGDHGGSRLGKVATNVAGGMVGGAIGKELQPLNKMLGTATAVVPAPLQPFARYGIGTTTAHVRSAGRAVNPFTHRAGGAPAPQQPYQNTQQQYSQPYAAPAAYAQSNGGYQQPVGVQQNAQGYYGNNMYGQGMPAQQPMMQQPMVQQPPQQYMQQPPMQQQMQQPYYQQPMQQPAPQQQYMNQAQPMMPQQNQMMPAPGYGQQMVPQQNYYR